MSFDDFDKAVSSAEFTMRMVDRMATRMARMLVKRLRSVESHNLLRELKRELGQFNSVTGKWKEEA